MPYRRLPNTDQARLRAMQQALKKAIADGSSRMLFSQKTFLEVQAALPIFEQSVKQYNDSREQQHGLSHTLEDASQSARMYLSHFLQVFNMCVTRGEIKAEARTLLGLQPNSENLPSLDSNALILEWGNKIIEGEARRTGNRIYNPSIANVRVKVEQFKDLYHRHHDLIQTIEKHHVKVEQQRDNIDGLIKTLWDEIEQKAHDLSGGIVARKRELAIEYGVVYVFRPDESEPPTQN